MTQLCDYQALPHGAQGDFTPLRKGHTAGFTTHRTGKTGTTTVESSLFWQKNFFSPSAISYLSGTHCRSLQLTDWRNAQQPNATTNSTSSPRAPRLFFTASLLPLRKAGHTCLGHCSRKLQHVIALSCRPPGQSPAYTQAQ